LESRTQAVRTRVAERDARAEEERQRVESTLGVHPERLAKLDRRLRIRLHARVLSGADQRVHDASPDDLGRALLRSARVLVRGLAERHRIDGARSVVHAHAAEVVQSLVDKFAAPMSTVGEDSRGTPIASTASRSASALTGFASTILFGSDSTK